MTLGLALLALGVACSGGLCCSLAGRSQRAIQQAQPLLNVLAFGFLAVGPVGLMLLLRGCAGLLTTPNCSADAVAPDEVPPLVRTRISARPPVAKE